MVQTWTNNPNGVTRTFGPWLIRGIASNFEIRYTKVEGDANCPERVPGRISVPIDTADSTLSTAARVAASLSRFAAPAPASSWRAKTRST
jgi:hypothetical protein